MSRFKNIDFEPLAEQSPEELEALRRIRNADEIRRYMYSDHEIDPEEHLLWFDRVTKSTSDRAIAVKYNKKIMGYAAIQQINMDHKTADWAFYIDPHANTFGVGSYIEFRILEIAFGELSLEKLNCAVLENNQPVVDLHRKFGFVLEGTRRSNIAKNGERLDVHLLGLTKSGWQAVRARFVKLFGD